MKTVTDWLIYGAYGYTGDLIARAAVERGLDPILAGRTRGKLDRLASELHCSFTAFELTDADGIRAALDSVDAVLNCAGPFADTYEPLVESAIETGTHYLDITGEIPVFEAISGYDEPARAAGVMLLPGVGFDVVPTDCLAAHLAERLPSGTELAMGFQTAGGFSPGTVKTAVEGLGDGGVIRREGRLESVPPAHRTRTIDFGEGPVTAATVPWGDVSTAYYTTGVQNVTFYAAFPESAIRAMRSMRYLSPVLSLDAVQELLKRVVDARVDGPDEQTRRETEALLWGELGDGDRTVVSRLRTPNTYRLTVETALEVLSRVRAGEHPPGFQTPAGAYGPDLVLAVDGVERTDE